MKVEIKKVTKKYNEFKVTMALTEGAILALKHALEAHAKAGSAISDDLLQFVKAAGEEAGIKW